MKMTGLEAHNRLNEIQVEVDVMDGLLAQQAEELVQIGEDLTESETKKASLDAERTNEENELAKLISLETTDEADLKPEDIEKLSKISELKDASDNKILALKNEIKEEDEKIQFLKNQQVVRPKETELLLKTKENILQETKKIESQLGKVSFFLL